MAGPPAEAAPTGTPVIVLAAGQSSRLGEPKGLVVVEGRTWIDRQLEALGGRRAVLVLGHDRDRYLPVILALGRPVDLVTNPDPDRGPFSSLQEGLAAVDAGSAAFVLPVDVPAPGKAVWEALEASLGAAEAAVPVHEGKGGHPVLLGPALVARLLTRPASSRLDEELRALPLVARVPVDDPRVGLNLNTASDWGRVREG
ncbi:MAG TPA: NTP transferase domain-containing protein [Polyangiaceae bacterium]|jgi:CTP:molybdopterin cytidylyltransferase MocA